MPPTTIHTAPPLDSFIPLTDHQSQTPTTFFGSKPILHYHIIAGRALISPDQASKLPIFGASSNGENSGKDESDAQASILATVDIFVSSENLTLFNSTTSNGISLPYPTISLHAIQRLPSPSPPTTEIQGLYMQLDLPSDQPAEDDEPPTIELTLLGPSTEPAPALGTRSETTIQKLFAAISACSNLHPDPISQPSSPSSSTDDRIIFEGDLDRDEFGGLPGVLRGASDGSLPPPFPGSGGWITAENVGDYFDEDGNWIDDREVVNGHGDGVDEEEEPETKRARRE